MIKFVITNSMKGFIIASIFIIVISAFIIDELKISELEKEIEYQENTITEQNIRHNINDSLKFECRTKDILILKLKNYELN